jgi:hypothetical protein
MKLKSRYKWFCHYDKDDIEGWFGPAKTIEETIENCLADSSIDESMPIYVAQGRKLYKDELDEFEDSDVTWQVETNELYEIRVLKRKETI